MAAAVRILARGFGQVAMAAAAAAIVLLFCAVASVFTLVCAAPLHSLRGYRS